MPTTVYNKPRPQDVLETLIEEEDEQPRNIEVCPHCHKENPRDLTFCAWCGAPLAELPATATLEQFHADQKAQEELETLKEQNQLLMEKMSEIDKMLGALRQVPRFEELLKEASKNL